MVRRGTTLVEMVLVLSITAAVVGAVASLYGFAMGRMGHASAAYAATQDAVWLADQIEAAVASAASCTEEVSGARKALKCVMPASGTDRDADGYIDAYSLVSVTRRGLEKWGTGARIWFYQADHTGAFGTTGTILWRARRTDDFYPTASDGDHEFAFASPTRVRAPLVASFTFEVDRAAQTVTFSVTASSLTRDERTAGPADASQSQSHTATRTVFWRNGRR